MPAFSCRVLSRVGSAASCRGSQVIGFGLASDWVVARIRLDLAVSVAGLVRWSHGADNRCRMSGI